MSNDIISKVWRKVEELAEKRGMTREEFEEWSDAEQYRSNISEDEALLIETFYANVVIERLETEGKDKLAKEIEDKYYWVRRFKKDFNKIDEVMKHLTDVCAYIKRKYDVEYKYERLFRWDDILYDLVIKKSRSKKAKYKRYD